MNEFDGYISYPNTKYIGKQIQIKEITKRILDQINYKPRFFYSEKKASDYLAKKIKMKL